MLKKKGNISNMDNKKNTTNKVLWDMYDDISEASINLYMLPDILLTVVEDLNIDERELTRDEELEIGRRRQLINSAIALASRLIREHEEKLEKIGDKYLKPEHTKTTEEKTK